jgi:hypothetical protein
MFNEYKKKSQDMKKIGVMFVIGIALLIISLVITDNGLIKVFIGTISSYLLVSSILDFFNQSNHDDELINKVCDCIHGESSATELGVIKIYNKDTNVSSKIIIEAGKSIDIMHVYAQSWTGSNRSELINALRNKKVIMRVILADYRSEVIINNYNNQYNTNDVSKTIEDVIKTWKKIYVDSGSNNNLKLYLYNGNIVNAIYLNEEKVVAKHFASNKARHEDEMTVIECKNKTNGLYDRYNY